MDCFDIKYWIRLPRFLLSLSKKTVKKIPADKCDNQCCKWIHPKYSNTLRGALAVGRKMGSAIALQRAWKLLHLIKRSLICNHKESKKPCSHYYLILLAPWCVYSQIWWDKYARITRASRAVNTCFTCYPPGSTCFASGVASACNKRAVASIDAPAARTVM